jgi:CHAT domain-containing protein
MRIFYRQYLAGDGKAEALRKAVSEVKAKPEYGHPRYWAGFILIGEG